MNYCKKKGGKKTWVFYCTIAVAHGWTHCNTKADLLLSDPQCLLHCQTLTVKRLELSTEGHM